MLLAIDMGNTQTAMGLFDGNELVQSWRMPTDRSYTADEIHVRLMGFFKMYGLSLDAVDAIAFAGVVPQLSREWHAVADRIAADAIVIGPQTAAVTKLRAARPQTVGADRVANAIAAETFYGAPAIVVDFGTATNIDVIDEDGYYIGGAIAPGIRISMDALAARAAKLASVPLEAPEHAIGRDTEECIKVGAVVGAAAIDGVQARYYIPLMLPFLYLFGNRKLVWKGSRVWYYRVLFLGAALLNGYGIYQYILKATLF